MKLRTAALPTTQPSRKQTKAAARRATRVNEQDDFSRRLEEAMLLIALGQETGQYIQR